MAAGSQQPEMLPLGVIRVAVQSARIYPWPRLLGRPPSAFLAVGTDQRRNVARTKHKIHSFEPMWMETLYVVVHPQDISLELNLYGHHEHRSDTLIGMKRYPVTDIINHGELTSVSSRIAKGGKDKAELLFDLTFYPVIPTSEFTGGALQAGILSLAVHEASNLDLDPHSDVMVQVKLDRNGSDIRTTQRKRGGADPVWDSTFIIFCPYLSSATVTIEVIDMHHGPESIGSFSLGLQDVLESSRLGTQWWPLNGSRSGKIRLDCKWAWIRDYR